MKRLLVVSVFLLAACGKRGDPRPPIPVIPKATSDLVVTQRATNVLLSWSYPALTTAGRSLSAIKRVVVYRYAEELPATPTAQAVPNAAPDPSVPPPVVQFGSIPLPTPAQFSRLSTRIDSIEGANLTAASVGSRLVFQDTPPFRSVSGRPLRLTYAVVTEGTSARGDLSNLAAIVPLDVAVAPSELTATANADGVALAWSAPQKAATGDAKPVIVGYDIYRNVKGQAPEQFAPPINPSPVTRTDYTDKPPYGSYEYQVTAVAAAGPPRIESTPSATAVTTFKDLQPPPAPATLSALVETRIVRLVWDAVDAPDLQGYNVYRWEGTIRLKLTPGPAKQTHFGDESVDPGIAYTYSVTAVDKSGNESAETKSQLVLVPKTP